MSPTHFPFAWEKNEKRLLLEMSVRQKRAFRFCLTKLWCDRQSWLTTHNPAASLSTVGNCTDEEKHSRWSGIHFNTIPNCITLVHCFRSGWKSHRHHNEDFILKRETDLSSLNSILSGKTEFAQCAMMEYRRKGLAGISISLTCGK